MEDIKKQGESLTKKICKVVRLNESNRDAFKKILMNQQIIESVLNEIEEIDEFKIESPSQKGLCYKFERLEGKMTLDLLEYA